MLTDEEKRERKRESSRKWREDNPDYAKRYYLDNKQERDAAMKIYYEENKVQISEKKKVYAAKYYAENKDEMLAKGKRYREENPEKMEAFRKAWSAANPDKEAKRQLEWARRNPDKVNTKRRKWCKANPDKVNATTARRRAARVQATPAWADEFILSEAYALAVLRTKATGVSHHVDHIVPLKVKTVCGLHCEHNLRVIPGRDNASKGNRHWPDMP